MFNQLIQKTGVGKCLVKVSVAGWIPPNKIEIKFKTFQYMGRCIISILLQILIYIRKITYHIMSSCVSYKTYGRTTKKVYIHCGFCIREKIIPLRFCLTKIMVLCQTYSISCNEILFFPSFTKGNIQHQVLKQHVESGWGVDKFRVLKCF